MISLQDIEINEITLGDTPVVSIDFGDIPVWPSGYYYELEFKNITYSSNTQLLASGANYATFTCYYRKYRSSNNTLVSTEEVIATPSSSYCSNEGTKLYFDYDNYKATAVSADSSASVSLSYNGLTATGYVSRQGNSSRNSYSLSAIVLSSTTADASGGNITYSGGDVTTTTLWSSGYSENPTTTAIAFTNAAASNNQATSVVGHIISYVKTVYIPSLSNHYTSGQSSYTFTSDSYNGQTVSVTVYQAQNARYSTQRYEIVDYNTQEEYESDLLTLPATPGSSSSFAISAIKFTSVRYDSGYSESESKSTLSNVTHTLQNQAISNGGCVTSVSPIGDGGWSCYYSANTSGTTKITMLLVSENSSGNVVAGLRVQQPSQ